MENNEYLIPANSKKSMLILNLFNKIDLVIFGAGLTLTFILILSMHAESITTALLILAPALICAFLVVPLPNHHNVRTFIKNVYTFFTNRRTYYWKGWCSSYGTKEDK